MSFYLRRARAKREATILLAGVIGAGWGSAGCTGAESSTSSGGNGNVLVCAGSRLSTGQTHVFEVRPTDGAVVWQITLPVGAGSYQAERLSPPPLVEPL